MKKKYKEKVTKRVLLSFSEKDLEVFIPLVLKANV